MSGTLGLRLAVIGAGKMGETILRRLLGEDVVTRDRVSATVRRPERRVVLERALEVRVGHDNREAVRGADVVLFCVKPQAARTILAEIADELGPEQLLVSIVASASTTYLEAQLPQPVPVVRAMPNTPTLIGAGMTALCGGRYAGDGHLETAEELFGPLGRTLRLDEKHFDAVTGLSASGPAFIYTVIESLAEGGVKVGLPRGEATQLAAQACLGAARMVLETGQHPALLKDAVTTPAGCTVDGLLTLEEGGLRVTLIKAVVESTRRASELVSEG